MVASVSRLAMSVVNVLMVFSFRVLSVRGHGSAIKKEPTRLGVSSWMCLSMVEKTEGGVETVIFEPLCTHLYCTFYPLFRSDMEGGGGM